MCKCSSWLNNVAALQLFQICLFCHCHWHELELTAWVAYMVASYASDQLVGIDFILVWDLLRLTLIKSSLAPSLPIPLSQWQYFGVLQNQVAIPHIQCTQFIWVMWLLYVAKLCCCILRYQLAVMPECNSHIRCGWRTHSPLRKAWNWYQLHFAEQHQSACIDDKLSLVVYDSQMCQVFVQLFLKNYERKHKLLC